MCKNESRGLKFEFWIVLSEQINILQHKKNNNNKEMPVNFIFRDVIFKGTRTLFFVI
jgi:hypothetical protein